MTPETARSLIIALWAVGIALVGAVVWISVMVFKFGNKVGTVDAKLERLEKGVEKVEKAGEQLAMIPLVKQQVEQLTLSITEERRRFNSVFPEMQQKVTALWERVFSLQNWRASRPNIGNGNGGGQ